MAEEIHNRVRKLRRAGGLTSKGELMSLAAIGRTLDPQVTRQAVYYVAEGRTESARIKDAIERELGQAYWIRRRTQDRARKAA